MLTPQEYKDLKVGDILVLTQVYGRWKLGDILKIRDNDNEYITFLVHSEEDVNSSNEWETRWATDKILEHPTFLQSWTFKNRIELPKLIRKSRINLLDVD